MAGAEGLGRLFTPVEVEGWTVVIVAGVALVVDIATAMLIFRLSKDSMNIRAAFLHNVADAMGSVAVIVGGALILLYDWRLVDPIVTLAISGYILWHSWQGIGPVIRVLMLASPDTPTLPEVIEAIGATEGVSDVHALHIWRMQEHRIALQAHVVMDDNAQMDALRARLKSMLKERFALSHVALELESASASCIDPPLIGAA